MQRLRSKEQINKTGKMNRYQRQKINNGVLVRVEKSLCPLGSLSDITCKSLVILDNDSWDGLLCTMNSYIYKIVLNKRPPSEVEEKDILAYFKYLNIIYLRKAVQS